MICYGFTCRKIMVQSVYILNILTGQYMYKQSYLVYKYLNKDKLRVTSIFLNKDPVPGVLVVIYSSYFFR